MITKTLQTGFLCFILLGLALQARVAAQTGVPFNQRDDEYRLLGLKRAKEAYDLAHAEFERQKKLHDRDLISDLDLARARTTFADAEVNYQQSLLAVLFEQQYVSVVEAVKYQSEVGRKHVRLKLENTSGGSGEFKKLINIDDELFNTLQPEIVNDVYVSLLNGENAIISQPYEAKIEVLRYGQPATIDFVLLQDLDAVTVNLIYSNGSQRSPKIYLQKDASVNKAIVQSEQFSQEVELGASASFDLTLELFSGETNTFKLEVVNLPSTINRYFVDPNSEARLSQFKFTESTNTRHAALRIFLPDRPVSGVSIDESIPFFVMVIPREQYETLGDLQNRHWTQEEIEALNVGFVKLDLVPSGVGKLLVRAPQLFHSIKPDENIAVELEVVNEGSRRLDNVEIAVDAPLNWKKSVTPAIIPQLNISAEKGVTIDLSPPPDIPAGRYEVRIRSSSLSDNQPIRGDDKTLVIEVKNETNVLGTALILLAIVGLVFGIVLYGIRLSRR